MNSDLRNSLALWAWAIGFGIFFWVFTRFDVLTDAIDKVPDPWLSIVFGVLAVWNLGRLIWGLWQRRASKDN